MENMQLNDYLTGEEKKQMEGLMKKAAERRRQNTGKPDEEVSGMYFEYRFKIEKRLEECSEQKAEDDRELRDLLGKLYNYCKRHGYDGQQEEPAWMNEIDEELPL